MVITILSTHFKDFPGKAGYLCTGFTNMKISMSFDLVDYIYAGNITALENVLNTSTMDISSLNLKDSSNLLHIAAEVDEVEIFELLYRTCPQLLYGQNIKGYNPLHICCMNNSGRVLRKILTTFENMPEKLNEYVRMQSKWNETPLHLAAPASSFEIVNTLVNVDVSLCSCLDKWNRTPYQIAKELLRPQSFFDVLSAGDANLIQPIEQEIAKSTPVHITAQKKLSLDFLAAVKLKRSKQQVQTDPILVRTIYKDTVDNIHYSNNLDNRKISKISLSQRVEYPGDITTIQSMLEDKDKYDASGKDMFGLTAIHKFSSWNKVDLIEMIVPYLTEVELNIASSNSDGFTALHFAVDSRALQTYQLLLTISAIDKNKVDKKNRTAKQLTIELELPQFYEL